MPYTNNNGKLIVANSTTNIEIAIRRLETELGRADWLSSSDPIVLRADDAAALLSHFRAPCAQPAHDPRPRKARRQSRQALLAV